MIDLSDLRVRACIRIIHDRKGLSPERARRWRARLLELEERLGWDRFSSAILYSLELEYLNRAVLEVGAARAEAAERSRRLREDLVMVDLAAGRDRTVYLVVDEVGTVTEATWDFLRDRPLRPESD